MNVTESTARPRRVRAAALFLALRPHFDIGRRLERGEACNDDSISSIEFPVAAEDAVLVEGNPPHAGKIGRDLRARGDTIMEFAEFWNFLLEGLHPLRESVTQAFD